MWLISPSRVDLGSTTQIVKDKWGRVRCTGDVLKRLHESESRDELYGMHAVTNRYRIVVKNRLLFR